MQNISIAPESPLKHFPRQFYHTPQIETTILLISIRIIWVFKNFI